LRKRNKIFRNLRRKRKRNLRKKKSLRKEKRKKSTSLRKYGMVLQGIANKRTLLRL
jgi:hypothetical protein